MNKEYFDEIIDSRMDEAEDLDIKDSFVKYCVNKFYSYETALKNIMSERKLQNRHKKFGGLSQDEKLKSVENYSIYKDGEKEFEDYIYLLLSVKLESKISYYIFYYTYYGELYK